MNIAVIVLFIVFVLIAARKIGHVHIRIWHAMTGGAVAVLLTGQITPRAALYAIDLDVMLFLLGMFIVGQALVTSGYLYYLAYRFFSRTRSADGLVLVMLFGCGTASALLMNDTLAIVGTPLALRLAREHRISARLMLLTLAFAITVGSVMSPIGNPQNLLIAARALDTPFLTFVQALAIPTLVNLFFTYVLLRVLLRSEFHSDSLVHAPVTLPDPRLARLGLMSVCIMAALIILRIALVASATAVDLRLSYIAIAAALPVLLFSEKRLRLLRTVDWPTLVFFAAMFVLMASVWQSGFFQSMIGTVNVDLTSVPSVTAVSLLLSQLISNVPLVALYLPLLQELGAGVPALMALAAGSTIAGNLLILGAASNVIMIQSAERHGVTLGFFEFARVGIPVAAVNVAVYMLYLGWWYGSGT